MGKTIFKIICIVNVFICLISGQITKEIRSGDPFKRIITSNDLRNSGASRLTDIFYLIDEWSVSSVDGFRLYSNGGGWNTFDNQDWILMLNGAEVDLKYFEFTHMNQLPISISDVEKVEIISIPVVYEGVFIKRGAVNIITKEITETFSFNSSMSTGNEIGDPGPYKYTEFQSENVDQIGPDYNLRLATQLGSFQFSLSGKYIINTSTDPAISFRNHSLPWEYKQTRQFSYYSSMIYENTSMKHELYFGKTKTGDPGVFQDKGTDMIFLNQLGGELFSNTEYNLTGLKGEIQLSDGISFNYVGNISNKQLKTYPINENYFSYVEDNVIGKLYAIYSHLGFSFQGGVSAKWNYITTSGIEESLFYNNITYFLSTTFNLSKDVFSQIDLSYYRGFYSNSFSGSASLGFTINKYNSLLFNFNTNGLTDEERRDSYTLAKDNIWFDEYQKELVEVSSQNNTDRILSADLMWLNSGNSHSLKTRLFYKSFSSYPVYRYFYELEQTKQKIKTTDIERSLSGGILAGLETDLKVELTDQITLNCMYLLTLALGEESILWKEFITMPNHNITLTLFYKLASTFTVWSKVKYLSETDWAHVIFNGTDSQNPYQHLLEGKIILDAGIRKQLWDNRLELLLVFKNLFSAWVVSHPFGSRFDTTMYLQINLNI